MPSSEVLPNPNYSADLDISVVIVGWNGKSYLQQCLESLTTARSCRSMEIIVVDNASSDGSPEMIEARFPEVKLIKSKENLGFAKGNNLAINQARGRFIALVNPDVIVFPGCLDALADFLDQHPKVGNVGPRILNPDLTLQSSCRSFPSLWNNFCMATGLSRAFQKSRWLSGEHMLYFPHDCMRAVDVLVGCFWMVRRETFQSVGLLDEGFFLYGEDLDWCRRCWTAGWEVMFFPGAQAIHHRGGSSAAQSVRCAVHQQVSILRYWSKHSSLSRVWGITTILLVHHFLRYIFAVASRLTRFRGKAQSDARKQVSRACMRAVLSESISNRT